MAITKDGPGVCGLLLDSIRPDTEWSNKIVLILKVYF
jgi:hypothetical protein